MIRILIFVTLTVSARGQGIAELLDFKYRNNPAFSKSPGIRTDGAKITAWNPGLGAQPTKEELDAIKVEFLEDKSAQEKADAWLYWMEIQVRIDLHGEELQRASPGAFSKVAAEADRRRLLYESIP